MLILDASNLPHCHPTGQHNDARMNLAIGLTAARYGAAMANYTEVVHLLKEKDPLTGSDKVCGAHCRDVLTGGKRLPHVKKRTILLLIT